MENEILNVREASELTRLSVATVYAYVARRKLPHLKVGAKLLFRRSDLEKWLDQHFVKPLERVSNN
jgi:excisionase family DNA binding protein